jgi:hypothetical protein
MKVTQPDSRTIRVLADSGLAFDVPYRFFWNGHERPAESIALTQGRGDARSPHEVRAFFLFGEIRDRISADAFGITLHRRWSVKTTGSVRLSVDLRFEETAGTRCLFPGVAALAGTPVEPVSFLGEKTSYPAALFIAMGKKGVLLFSASADCGREPSIIGVRRVEAEDQPRSLLVELLFPGAETPASRIGPRPEHAVPPVESAIETRGTLEMSHQLFVAHCARDQIQVKGATAVFERLKIPAGLSVDVSALAHALQGTLKTHLVEKGGVAGMRELPGSPWISSAAGLGLAVCMRRLFPKDDRLQELALRLADFSLKGQLPSGFFYESFHLGNGGNPRGNAATNLRSTAAANSRSTAAGWRGVKGEPAQTLLSVGRSAHIADLLLTLSDDLRRDGLPHEKYYLAGLRFVDFFFDTKGRLCIPGGLHPARERRAVPASVETLAGMEIFFPMAHIHARTGRDRYKKALDLMVRRFSALPWDPFDPPGSRDGRGADAAGALLAVSLFAQMRALGYRPVEPPASGAAALKARAAEGIRLFASLLVPWIRLHPAEVRPGVGPSEAAMTGCLADSFARQRLLLAGHQTALLLARLGGLAAEPEMRLLLQGFALQCLGSAQRVPLGTSFFQHTRWDTAGKAEGAKGKSGPVDSRWLAAEVLAGMKIAEDYPKLSAPG